MGQGPEGHPEWTPTPTPTRAISHDKSNLVPRFEWFLCVTVCLHGAMCVCVNVYNGVECTSECSCACHGELGHLAECV